MGYTVSPTVYTDESGQEHISYENADIQSTSGKEQALRQFEYEQEQYFVEDERTGEVTHRYEDIDDPELLYDELTDDAYEPEDIQYELPEQDVDYIQSHVGGAEQYGLMMQWANESMPSEFIEGYDALMETGDVEEMLAAVKNLYEIYMQGEYEIEESDDYDTNDEPLDSELSEFVESVYQAFGNRKTYEDALAFASENWTQSAVSTYDRALDSGDPEIIGQAVDLLYSAYFNS